MTKKNPDKLCAAFAKQIPFGTSPVKDTYFQLFDPVVDPRKDKYNMFRKILKEMQEKKECHG